MTDGIETNTTVPITVAIKNVNHAPSADAGAAQTVCETESTVALSGSASDQDGDAITGIAWTQVAGPPVSLIGANAATPSFAPPAVSAAEVSVTLTFKLSVSDACSASDPEALAGESTVDVIVIHANRAPVV